MTENSIDSLLTQAELDGRLGELVPIAWLAALQPKAKPRLSPPGLVNERWSRFKVRAGGRLRPLCYGVRVSVAMSGLSQLLAVIDKPY